jgi:hypothetical protein
MSRRTRAQRRRERQLREAGITTLRVPKSKRNADDAPQPQTQTSQRLPRGDPTPERLAKGGLHIARSPLQDGGHRETRSYRSPPPIERMRNECKLDHDEAMNEAMYQQAVQLEQLARKAGMSTVPAQDLTRVFTGSGGGTDPSYMMPRTEAAAAAKGELNHLRGGRRGDALQRGRSHPLRCCRC